MTEYRVIYVDDDQAFLDLGVSKLQQYPSITVIDETSPQACLEHLCGEGRIHCLVADYDMPEMDGLELLSQVREINPDLPYILFTARGSEEIASRAISAGVTDYLSKHEGSNQFELLANRIQNYADQYRANQALQKERHRNKYALQAVSDVVWERDPTTGTLQVSDGFTGLTGYDSTDVDLSFEWWTEHIHPDDRDRVKMDFNERLSAGQTTFSGEYRFRRADGSYIVVEDNGYVLYDEDDNPRQIMGAIRDITVQRERQQELERYHQVIDTVAAGVFVLNDAGEFDLMNQRLTELTGYDHEELLGAPVTKIVHEDTRTEVESTHEQVMADEARPLEWRMTSATNGSFPAESRVTGLADEYGGGTVWAVADMAHREQRERELQRQNERLDQFATIVSHDLRNPLSVAKGFSEMAQETGETEKLDRVMMALDRMEAIVDDVLELARQGQTITNPSAMSLRRSCERAWESVNTKDAQLRAECDPDVLITADGDRLQRLFENLIRNAIEHGGDDVTVYVDTDENGFSVTDDGSGIPASDRETVFEAGYSTSDQGTGFGLNIVKQIVEAHDWQITVTASECGGARFEITGATITA